MERARAYIEKIHNCSTQVVVDGNWYNFKLNDGNPFQPVIGVYPLSENHFYPRGANYYYFPKKVWNAKSLYVKEIVDKKKITSGPLILTSNPKMNKLTLTSYQVPSLDADLPEVFDHILDGDCKDYLLKRTRYWKRSANDKNYTIEGYVYFNSIFPDKTDNHPNTNTNTNTSTKPTKSKKVISIDIFTELIGCYSSQYIFIDQLLYMLDSLFLDKSDKSYIDSESPVHWRVDNKEDRLFKVFRRIANDQIKLCKTPKKSAVQNFKDGFTKIFNMHGCMSDAWHPLHEGSLREMIHMPLSGSSGSCIDARYYQPDSFGFVCFIYTKEGQDVGLVRYLAKDCKISESEQDNIIKNIHNQLSLKPLFESGLKQGVESGDDNTIFVPVMIDGTIRGYVNTCDTNHSSIHWTQYCQETGFGKIFHISPNGGILYRNVHDKNGLERKVTIQQQVHQPLIWEQDIWMLDGESYLSTMGSSLPLPQHNSAVRPTFTCCQRKSAATISPNEKVYYSLELINPESPRISTQTETEMQIKDGQNVPIAIMPFYGYNTEDSLVVSEEALLRGDFDSLVTEIHTLRAQTGQSITIPLDIQVGSDVCFGQLIGLICGTSQRHIVGGSSDEIIESITHQSTHVGKIHEIKMDGNREVQVIVKTNTPLSVGDKLASRYGQKGIISKIIPLSEMPYTATGVRPSLIINPHAFPTRMTLGQFIESILIHKHKIGKNHSLQIVNFDKSYMMDSADSAANDCMTTLYNPKTFEPYTEKVFVGIVYYMVLKRKVSWSVKARGRSGKRHPLTGQAVHSRKNNGGTRIGEMEVAQLLAQNADILVKELFNGGDGVEATYCHRCKRWDNVDIVFEEEESIRLRPFCNQVQTNSTKSDNSLTSSENVSCGPYTRHKTTRAFLLLWEEAMAAGIQMDIE